MGKTESYPFDSVTFEVIYKEKFHRRDSAAIQAEEVEGEKVVAEKCTILCSTFV